MTCGAVQSAVGGVRAGGAGRYTREGEGRECRQGGAVWNKRCRNNPKPKWSTQKGGEKGSKRWQETGGRAHTAAACMQRGAGGALLMGTPVLICWALPAWKRGAGAGGQAGKARRPSRNARAVAHTRRRCGTSRRGAGTAVDWADWAKAGGVIRSTGWVGRSVGGRVCSLLTSLLHRALALARAVLARHAQRGHGALQEVQAGRRRNGHV